MSRRFAEDARTTDAAAVRADHLSLEGPGRFFSRARHGLHRSHSCRNNGQNYFHGFFPLMKAQFREGHNSPALSGRSKRVERKMSPPHPIVLWERCLHLIYWDLSSPSFRTSNKNAEPLRISFADKLCSNRSFSASSALVSTQKVKLQNLG